MDIANRKIPKFATDQREFSQVLRKRVNEYFSSNKISTDANGKMIAKTIFFLTLWIGSYAVLITQDLTFLQTWIVWAIWGFSFAGGAANIGHDAIHGSYTKNSFVTKVLKLTFDLNGASSYNWNLMHNVAHHTYTNIVNHDEDIHPVDVLRLCPDAEYKPMHKYQYIYCFFLYPLATISWALSKDYVKFFKNTVANYNNRQHPKKEYFFLFFFKFLNYLLFMIIPFMVIELPFWQKLVCFLSAHFIAGMYLGLIFMLAHCVDNVEFPTQDETGMTENNWFIHQMKTTSNFAVNSKLAAFLSGGLNQQVEHHLFPNVCSIHYPNLSNIVRDTAKEFNVVYHEYPTFWQALKAHWRFMYNMSLAPVKA
jgi:linoleoyl-CoA desaturase